MLKSLEPLDNNVPGRFVEADAVVVSCIGGMEEVSISVGNDNELNE